MTDPVGEQAGPKRRGSALGDVLDPMRRGIRSNQWRVWPVLVALAAIWIIFAISSPVFLSSHNLSNLSLQIVVTSTVSLGLVLVLLVGEIDLSVGFLGAVCAAVAAQLSVNLGMPLAVALAGGLLAGALWGMCQGWIVTRFQVPSFIVTLGGMLMLTAAIIEVLPSDGQILLAGDPLALIANTYIPSWLSYAGVAAAVAIVAVLKLQSFRQQRGANLAASFVGVVALPIVLLGGMGVTIVAVLDGYRGVPVALAILLLLLSLFGYLTTQTRFGIYIYAIGGNAEAARRAGIPVRRVKIVVFMLTGALAGAGGIIASSRVLTVSTQALDPSLLLEAIAAAVIGGASLFGGRGSVWAALTGALVMGSVTNGLLLLNVPTAIRLEIQGAILILAVVADAVLSRSTSTPSS